MSDKGIQCPEEKIIYPSRANWSDRSLQYPCIIESRKRIESSPIPCKVNIGIQCPSSTDIQCERGIQHPGASYHREKIPSSQYPRCRGRAESKGVQHPSESDLRVEKCYHYPRRGPYRVELDVGCKCKSPSRPPRQEIHKDKGVQCPEKPICIEYKKRSKKETKREQLPSRSIRFRDDEETESSYSDHSHSDGDISDYHKTSDDDDSGECKYSKPQGPYMCQLICQEAYDFAHQIMQTSFGLPLIIIDLKPNLPSCTLEWLISRIQSTQKNGGADMKVLLGFPKRCQALFLGIDADVWRLSDAAKRAGMVKWSTYGQLTAVTPETLPLFIEENKSEDSALTTPEKQYLIHRELIALPAFHDEKTIPGRAETQLYTGQSIILKCQEEGLVKQIIPLHETLELTQLSNAVRWPFEKWKIDLMAFYFGPSIAVFFGLVLRYLYVLLASAIIALLIFILVHTASRNISDKVLLSVNNEVQITLPAASQDRTQDWVMVMHAIINLCASVVFLLMTKRYMSEMIVRWAAFTTGPGDNRPRKEPSAYGQYSSHEWKNFFKEFCISLPLTLLLASMVFAFVNVLLAVGSSTKSDSASVKDVADSDASIDTKMTTEIPLLVIVCAVFLWISVWLFVLLARHLTEWEGHLLESQFHSSLVGKIVLFVVIACFSPVLYVIIVQRDAEKTKNYALFLVIIFAIMDVGRDIMILLLSGQMFGKGKAKPKADELKDPLEQFPLSYFLGKKTRSVPRIPPTDAIVEEAEKQMKLVHYKDTVRDFLAVYVNMGFIFLYSAMAPIACSLSLVYLFILLPLKVFRLCKGQQRPFSVPSLNALGWQNAIEFLVVLAVCTNCLLLSFSSSLKERWGKDYSDLHWFAIFIWLLHIFLIIVVAVIFLAPSARQTAEAAFAEDQRDIRPASRIFLMNERNEEERRKKNYIRKKDSFKIKHKPKADDETQGNNVHDNEGKNEKEIERTNEDNNTDDYAKENEENDKRNEHQIQKKPERKKDNKKSKESDESSPGIKSRMSRAFGFNKKKDKI